MSEWMNLYQHRAICLPLFIYLYILSVGLTNKHVGTEEETLMHHQHSCCLWPGELTSYCASIQIRMWWHVHVTHSRWVANVQIKSWFCSGLADVGSTSGQRMIRMRDHCPWFSFFHPSILIQVSPFIPGDETDSRYHLLPSKSSPTLLPSLCLLRSPKEGQQCVCPVHPCSLFHTPCWIQTCLHVFPLFHHFSSFFPYL